MTFHSKLYKQALFLLHAARKAKSHLITVANFAWRQAVSKLLCQNRIICLTQGNAVRILRAHFNAKGHPQKAERATTRQVEVGEGVAFAQDVIERRAGDFDLTQDFMGRGLCGFALETRHIPTAERAAVVAPAVSRIEAYGAIALNHSVGRESCSA